MRLVHRVFPLDEEVTSARFRAAFPDRGRSAFVLDGGGSERLDRFSFMGAEPALRVRAARTQARDERGRARLEVTVERGAERTTTIADPLRTLRRVLEERALPLADAPFPFRAGLVGYLGYEYGQALESLPGLPRPRGPLPDVSFGLHLWVIASSRAARRSWLSVIGEGDDEASALAAAAEARDRVVRRLAAAAPATPAPLAPLTAPARSPATPEITAALDRAAYLERIARAKAHILAGDAFEICLTNELSTALAREDAWPLFEELRRSNASPFAAMLDLPEGAIVSSSPERFLRLTVEGDRRIAESRPIKGTRPRGASAREDQELAEDLAASIKDRAENAMIVDLVRNDLGRVCRFGTVTVPELFAVERYATVHQLVSTIRGELAEGVDAFDLVQACFPPGSMTGAPKIEAMAILEGLEPRERGVYAGALGWIDLSGALDLSVVIRTVVVGEGRATFGVGGAIVADSDPAQEHAETADKARALVAALGRVGAGR